MLHNWPNYSVQCKLRQRMTKSKCYRLPFNPICSTLRFHSPVAIFSLANWFPSPIDTSAKLRRRRTRKVEYLFISGKNRTWTLSFCLLGYLPHRAPMVARSIRRTQTVHSEMSLRGKRFYSARTHTLRVSTHSRKEPRAHVLIQRTIYMFKQIKYWRLKFSLKWSITPSHLGQISFSHTTYRNTYCRARILSLKYCLHNKWRLFTIKKNHMT